METLIDCDGTGLPQFIDESLPSLEALNLR